MHDVPLLAFEALDPRLQAQLRPRVERLGYLGEFFRVFAHQPDSLLAFNALTEALKQALPDRTTEIVALSVATHARNDYERNQHIRLCRKLGFSDNWVEQVLALKPDTAPDLSESDQHVQRFVLAALADFGRGSLEPFRALCAVIGVVEAVAVLLLVGRYLCHALAVNCLELAPPVSNPLDEQQR